MTVSMGAASVSAAIRRDEVRRGRAPVVGWAPVTGRAGAGPAGGAGASGGAGPVGGPAGRATAAPAGHATSGAWSQPQPWQRAISRP